MTFIADTHAIVWFLEGNRRLSQAARDALSDPSAQIAVPTMVLAEITFLVAKGRISINTAAVLAHVAQTANCLLYPLDEAVVERLATTLEIHDAIIVATALVFRDVLGHQVAVLTRDAEIASSGLVDVVW